jgi:hypothetical protein
MLPAEIEAAVVAQHGGPVTVPGKQGNHVVMSAEMYRDIMGVGDDEEFAQSVAEIKISLAQVAAGDTISLEELRARLTEKYGD